MMPAKREVDVTADDEEKGIWLVTDKAKKTTDAERLANVVLGIE